MENKSHVEYIQTHRESKEPSIDENQIDTGEFVGLQYGYDEDKNGTIKIFYPKSLGNIEERDFKEKKRILLKLISSLKIAKNSDISDNYYSNSIKNKYLDKFPLYSYMWIWDDYKKNGRMISSEHKDAKNASGKINWEKTFQGDPLFYNGNVYYTDIVYRKKVLKEDLLTEIHDYCVYRSLEMLFFLTNLSHNIIHPLYKNINGRRKEYISFLKEAIELTFDDEKKLRFKHMLNIVDYSSFDSLRDKNMIGVNRYASIFEKQIDDMLGNVDDKTEYYPKSFLHVNGIPKDNSCLKPDTINVTDEICYIIDSKFYEFGNMPATESVEKQIVYGEHAEYKKGFPDNNIHNIFLIPRSFKDEFPDDKIIKYYGYMDTSWKNGNKCYEKVHVYFIDFMYVLNNYRKGYNAELFDEISKDVIKR